MLLKRTILVQLMVIVLKSSGYTIQPGDVENRIVSLYYLTNISDDFSQVKKNSEQIMQWSDQIERPDLKLLGFHLICWSADYHREMDEFLKYVEMGNRFMAEQAERIAVLDTGAGIRAGMIHATGQYYYALGNYTRSIEEFIKIVPINGPPMTTDSGMVMAVCSYIGQSYINLGDLDKSLQYFELAKRFNQENEEYNYFNALHQMYLAQYYHSIGKTETALIGLNKALPLLLADKRLAYVRNAKKSIYLLYASYYRQMDKYDSALHYTRKSINLYTKNDPTYVEGYRLMGDIFHKSNRPDSALFYYERSLNLSENIYSRNHYTNARSLNGIGNILRDEKKFNQAYNTYIKALSNLVAAGPNHHSGISEIILPQEGMSIMVDLGKLYYSWFQSDGKREYLDSCITVLEKALYLNDLSRREQFNTESKESRAKLQADITDLGINASAVAYEESHQPGYLQKAFFFMEKNKGNILLDRIYESKARSFSGIPDSLLDREFRLKKEVSLYRDRLLSASFEDSIVASIKRKYEDKQFEYINLISGIEKNYNKYYTLKYNSESLTADQVRKLIPSSDQMILQYYVGADKIYMAAITRKKIIIKSTPRNEDFIKNLSGLSNQINNKEITEIENDRSLYLDFIRYSRYLYTHLVEPVLKDAPSIIRDFTIIPDGILCYLPFEVLLSRDPDKKNSDYSELPYLVKDCRITYDHSASLIFTSDHIAKKNKKKYLGFAPGYENRNPNLSRLSANLDEIEACRKIWNGSSFTGEQATELNFRNSASAYDIVHLAAHTILNDEDPQGSSLVFASSDTEEGKGMLYVHELYNMDMNTRLMILSACETGTGQIKRGEGIISLARAFRYAGCHNILMSLWKVNDRTTKDIMVLFNRNLKKGMAKNKALQLAKLKYLEGDRNLHPAFWASMILIGDQKPVAGRIGYKLVLPALFLLIIIILFRKKIFNSRMTPRTSM